MTLKILCLLFSCPGPISIAFHANVFKFPISWKHYSWFNWFFFSSLARFHKYLNTSLIDFYILGSQKLSENFRALFVEITGVKFQGHSSTCVFGKYEF